MMNWCSSVDCTAPFTENEFGDYERVEQQTVAKGYGRTLLEAQANAIAIAAIPEMLEAIEKIVKFADSEPDGGTTVEMHRANIERARGAFRKATGAK